MQCNQLNIRCCRLFLFPRIFFSGLVKMSGPKDCPLEPSSFSRDRCLGARWERKLQGSLNRWSSPNIRLRYLHLKSNELVFAPKMSFSLHGEKKHFGFTADCFTPRMTVKSRHITPENNAPFFVDERKKLCEWDCLIFLVRSPLSPEKSWAAAHRPQGCICVEATVWVRGVKRDRV